MNNATFAGRLGRDAETRHTQGGNAVTNFSLAVDEYAGQGERRTLWIDCSMWGERGEKLAEYLAKGTPVAVSGQVGVRTYESQGETRAVVTLNVREVTLLGSRQDGGGEHTESRPARQAPAQSSQSRSESPTAKQKFGSQPGTSNAGGADFADDDIPF